MRAFNRNILQDEAAPSLSSPPSSLVKRPPLLRSSVFDAFHHSAKSASLFPRYSPSLSISFPPHNETWSAISKELKERQEYQLRSHIVMKHIDILNQFYPPLYIKPIAGDGRCFFASVLDQIHGIAPSPAEVTEFKRQFYAWLTAWCVDVMDDRRRLELCQSLFPKWVNDSAEVILDNIKEYIRIKSVDSLESVTYIDHPGILLMSTYLQRPILIYSYLVSADFRIHFCIHHIPPFAAQDPSFAFKNTTEPWSEELRQRPLLLVHTHLHLQNKIEVEHYESLIPTPWNATKRPSIREVGQLQNVYGHFPSGLCHIQPHMSETASSRRFVSYIRTFQSMNTCSQADRQAVVKEREGFESQEFTPTQREETLRRVSWDVRSNNDVRLSSVSVEKLWKPNSRLDDASIYAFLTMWSEEWGRQNPSIKHSLLIVQDTMFYQYISRSTAEEWEQIYDTFKDLPFVTEDDVLMQRHTSIWGEDETIRRALDPPYKLLLKAQSKSPFPWTTSAFQYNQWILPIFLPSAQHWVMLYVSLVDRIIFVFDPLPIERRQCATEEKMCWQIFWFMSVLFSRHVKHLESVVPDWKTHAAYKQYGKQVQDRFNPDEWKFYQSNNPNLVPFQDNQDDCGMFVLLYIETISKMLDQSPRPFAWDSTDIPRKRHEYALRLLKKYSTNVVDGEAESSLSRSSSFSSLMEDVESGSEAASYVDTEESMRSASEPDEEKTVTFGSVNQVRQFASQSILKAHPTTASTRPSKPSLKRSRHAILIRMPAAEAETRESDEEDREEAQWADSMETDNLFEGEYEEEKGPPSDEEYDEPIVYKRIRAAHAAARSSSET